MLFRSAPFREQFDAAWLKLPILGKMSRSYNSARFASTLAMLASAGVPILKALQAAAQTLSNRAMQLATLLEPLLIVAMGGVVMLIVLAVLMPIIQLNQLVR